MIRRGIVGIHALAKIPVVIGDVGSIDIGYIEIDSSRSAGYRGIGCKIGLLVKYLDGSGDGMRTGIIGYRQRNIIGAECRKNMHRILLV